jgi:hypothetical protein
MILPERGTVADYVRAFDGLRGIAKAISGVDRASEETIEARLAVCRSCPSGLFRDGVCDSRGGGCGCLLRYKVRLASESCPKSHW